MNHINILAEQFPPQFSSGKYVRVFSCLITVVRFHSSRAITGATSANVLATPVLLPSSLFYPEGFFSLTDFLIL